MEAGVSFFHPAVGYFIGEVAFFFDTGVYINDVFTSGFDGDVIKKAASSTVSNGRLFTVGTMAYLGKLGEVSNKVGDINSGITIVVTVVDWIKNKIKEWIDEQKKKRKR